MSVMSVSDSVVDLSDKDVWHTRNINFFLFLIKLCPFLKVLYIMWYWLLWHQMTIWADCKLITFPVHLSLWCFALIHWWLYVSNNAEFQDFLSDLYCCQMVVYCNCTLMFDISIIFYTLLLRKQIEFSMFKSRRQKKTLQWVCMRNKKLMCFFSPNWKVLVNPYWQHCDI